MFRPDSMLRPDALDLALEPRLQLAEHRVAEEPVGLDHLDRREPPAGHQREILRKEPGHLLDPASTSRDQAGGLGMTRPFEDAERLVQELLDAAAARGDDGDDGDAQPRGQLRRRRS